MSIIKKIIAIAIMVITVQPVLAQAVVRGTIIDNVSKEPVAGATIQCTDKHCTCGCTTDANGVFEIKCTDCTTLLVSHTGYTSTNILVGEQVYTVYMSPSAALMQEIVVSANRGEGVKRSEAPVAITSINLRTIQEAKATTMDQVLNKVSGVNVVSLSNEQHQMSIRQPITTKSLFLYLEDGIPIRTTGLFNHNALLEMNMASAKSIEVIKGPSSSLYGSEAVGGVVNVITLAPTATPLLKLSTQANNIGYKRADLQSSFTTGKWGFVASGYYANKRDGYLPYSNFQKGTFTVRADYRISDKTSLTNSFTWLHYYSQMASGIDSLMFATKQIANPQTFTFRQVNGVRYHSTLTHNWSSSARTTASLVFRNNAIDQNPAYRIKDDYKKTNGIFSGDKTLAHGEINKSSFKSFAFIGQHKQSFSWNKAVLIGGVSVDVSPSAYTADYIRIKKDVEAKKYVSFQRPDSVLTNYTTNINNYAAFANFAMNATEKLRLVASLRYDLFHYNFNNQLAPSAFSGAPDAINTFHRLSPKLGTTYNFSGRTGVYANYSQGFVPPQISELYTGVKVPYLAPSLFYNYEAGGWAAIIKNHLSADISIYKLLGTNEIISVKLDDGSYLNQNAGKTSHQGVEAGVNAMFKDLSFRFSGAYSMHRFIDYVEKGSNYSNNEMNNAPHVIYNSEIWYKPSFAKGLRVGAEVQHVGKYFADAQNTATYNGYYTLNLRTAYQKNSFEVWVNVLNATNNYYSTITTKSANGYSYQLADPINVTLGVSYDFGNLFKP